ncbi:hypothetical protein ANO11243_018300 [Dothideomycetidae sp. 11243]|nr:hypothetical protein ANO11243_018300 [fungal sp. No.11243]
MDALKAFSASQIAWVSQSPSAQQQSVQYSTSALSGLRQAVGQFNNTNADSVLATTCILVSQSKDWLSWSSFLGGINSIAAIIESRQQDSIYSDNIKRINACWARQAASRTIDHFNFQRGELLSRINRSLQQLRAHFGTRPVEIYWIDQCLYLIQCLQTIDPANTVEDQFNHLIVLRRLVFWLPAYLLHDGSIDMLKLSVVMHLYAVALALEPFFPGLSAELYGDNAAPALLHGLDRMKAMQPEMHSSNSTPLMQFPDAILAEFNA